METKTITFKIQRSRPNRDVAPRYDTFTVDVTDTMTLLDCLEQIRLDQDPSLMFRHSCHHASCGTCACRINGKEMLACTTQVAALESDEVVVEPLANLAPVGDLAVDMQPFFEEWSTDWRHVRASERATAENPSSESNRTSRFENCIECGACWSACPVVRRHPLFLGPAVLAAIHAEFLKTGKREVLASAANESGERLCERAVNCSRVCPAGVQPARQIQGLRLLFQDGASE